MSYARPGDLYRIALSHLEHGYLQLRADGLQLLDGGGTVDVAGHEQRALALLLHQRGELGAVGGLAGALQTDEHDHARRLAGYVELLVVAAHQRAELLVDYLDDHLRGREALEHLRALRALADALYKVLDDFVADVGLEQRQANLAHGLRNVLLRQASLAAEPLECRGELFRKAFKCQGIPSVRCPAP